jgi:hypothetical protein
MRKEYNWLSMVHQLSNEDITKHELVYEMNLFYCLDVLSYLTDKAKYEEYQMKKMQAKYK